MATQEKKKSTGRKTAGAKTGSRSKSTGSTSNSKSEPKKKTSAEVSYDAKAKEKIDRDKGVIDNVWGIIFIVLGVFLFAAVRFNAAGQLGNIMGDFLKGVFGLIGVLLPFYLIISGLLLLLGKTVSISGMAVALGIVMLLMFCLLNSGRFISADNISFDFKDFYNKGITLEGGGLFGMTIGMVLVKYLGKVGLYGIASAGILVCLLLLINTPISRGIESLKEKKRERRERKEAKAILTASTPVSVDTNNQQLEINTVSTSNTLGSDGSLGLYNSRKPQEGKWNPFRREKVIPKEQAILDIMNSKDNFDKSKEGEPVDLIPKTFVPSYGIEDQRVTKKGFGLGYEDEDDLNLPHNPNLAGSFVATAGGKAVSVAAQPFERIKPEIITSSDLQRGTYEDNQSGSSKQSDVATDISETKSENTYESEQGRAKVISYNPDEADKALVRPNDQKISKAEARAAQLDAGDFAKVRKAKKYKKPPIDLLRVVKRVDDGKNLSAELQERAQILEDTLRNFNVDARVVQVTQGPAVTRYEIQPNIGVKVSKITSLADDIALNLRAKSIRIEAPIPGKAAVGVEVENESVNMVTLREIIDSREFKQAKSKITFAVGRDIGGKAIIANLKDMPHLLIAGSTGSGKSVCINGIITSLLYKADPEDVRLILIDPKRVELGIYANIPHLLIPVVTDATKAAAALNWAVSEMNDRYNKFAATKVRDLEGYNEYVEAELLRRKNKSEDYDSRSDGIVEEPIQKLPQIVIIIDELADLMLAAPSQVEESIQRIAQLARAAGMHLIVATQRPSVDVITGVIKNNIPSRIAFAVPSQHDSKTILDKSGAEKLVGKGDMLYHPLGSPGTTRVQGCFVSDEEINDIIHFVEAQTIEADYNSSANDAVTRGSVSSDSTGSSDEKDELFEDALAFVIAEGKASTSLLQRRYRIGYNRAARIVDQLHEMGYIGPQDGSKPRQVLMTQEEYDAKHGIIN